jgi:ligand-binding SRPBCC domain-containing protein
MINMKIYSLTKRQLLPTTLANAWKFFSNPSNLATITPASMKFGMTSRTGGNEMYAGQLIQYKVTILPSITVDWLTEITHVRPPFYFVDEQRAGPYALWHHQHHFREVGDGVEVLDEINYALGYGPLGNLANRLFVRKRLKHIFDYREQTLSLLFDNKKQFQT